MGIGWPGGEAGSQLRPWHPQTPAINIGISHIEDICPSHPGRFWGPLPPWPFVCWDCRPLPRRQIPKSPLPKRKCKGARHFRLGRRLASSPRRYRHGSSEPEQRFFVFGFTDANLSGSNRAATVQIFPLVTIVRNYATEGAPSSSAWAVSRAISPTHRRFPPPRRSHKGAPFLAHFARSGDAHSRPQRISVDRVRGSGHSPGQSNINRYPGVPPNRPPSLGVEHRHVPCDP